jgi:oligoribonuclease (3'-5' exoribonuclease)
MESIKKLNFVSVDVETGGLNENESSILDIGMASFINNERGPELGIQIKWPTYKVSDEAAKINGFDIKKHEQTAISPMESLNKIKTYALLLKKLNNGQKILPMGRNISFDKRFLLKFFKEMNENFEDYFDYHVLDTTGIGFFLWQIDAIDIFPSNGDKICEALNLPIEPRPHIGINGARINIDVYEKTIETFNNVYTKKVLIK